MARTSATIDIGINVPASEMRKAEAQLQSLFNKTQSFNKNPIIAKNFTQPLGRITGAANEFNKSLEASNARVIAFGASAGAIFAVQKAMTELVKTTIKVEQQLTNIQVLLGATGKEFERFSDGLFKSAKATGSSFNSVAESAEEFARQGLNVEATLKRTTAAMTLAKLGGMDVKNATESLTAAINTFGKAAGDATTIVNKMAQVDAKFAVSSGDLAEAIKRTGAAANSANVSFEELISIVTTAQERTARGGAVIGNSFKTIFTRIQRPETLRQLESLGVRIRKTSGEMLPAMKVLQNYAKVYEGLAPSLRATSSEMLAGVFQVNVLKSVLPELANETGRYAAALSVANNTTNEATDRLKVLTSTTEGTLNATMVNLTKFAKEVGDLTIKPALDRILKMLNGFADLISPKNFFGLGETIGTAVYEGMGKIIGGPGLALLGFVLVKIGAKLAVFVKDAAAGFMGIETASQKLANTQNVIQNILAKRPELINQAVASEEGMVAVARVLAQKLKESSMEMERLTLAAQKAAPAVLAMQGGAKSTGGRKTKAGGFIPSFNMAATGFVPNFNQAGSERRLAKVGGYQAGKIREATIPGVGKVTYNGNEDLKQMPGLKQPAILPPRNSVAGQNYRETYERTHGYDPYNISKSGFGLSSGLGFVPNFATLPAGNTPFMFRGAKTNRSGVTKGYAGATDKERAALAEQGYTPEVYNEIQRQAAAKKARPSSNRKLTTIDVAGALGILSFYGDSRGTAHAQLPATKISALRPLINKDPSLKDNSVRFENVQVKSFQKFDDHAKGPKGSEFFSKMSDSLAGPVVDLASFFTQKYLGNNALSKSTKDSLKTHLKRSNAFLPPGAEGQIFESVASLLVKDPSKLPTISEAGGGWKDPFDFEEGAAATKNFGSFFGFKPGLRKADGKRTASQDALNTLVNKAYNQFILDPKRLGAMFTGTLPGMQGYGGGAMGAAVLSDKERAGVKKTLIDSKRVRPAMGLGFIPNFAPQETYALSDAIRREDRYVQKNKIRVGQDDRLKGKWGVYNTDEGSLKNAINMHIGAGASLKDIQRMGAGLGFVPNFAKGGGKSGDMSEGGMAMQMGMMMLGSQMSVMSDSMEAANEGTSTLASSLLDLSGQTMMYLPMVQMATASYGGIGTVLGKLNKTILSGAVAMASLKASTIKASLSLNALSMSGLGAMFGGKTIGGVSNWGRAKGAFAKGKHRALNPSAAARAAGAKPATWLGATARGVAGASSSLSAGGGLLGAAASPLGIAAVGGLAAYGANKGMQAIYNKEGDEARKKVADLAKKNAEEFANLNKHLGKASEATDSFAKSIAAGDRAQAARAKNEIIRQMNLSGAGETIAREGGITTESGTKYGSKAEVIKKIQAADTSVEEIREINAAIKRAASKFNEISQKTAKAGTALDAFADNQGMVWSTDTSAQDMSAAAEGFAELLSGVGPEKAQEMLAAFKKLGKEGTELADDYIIYQDEAEAYNRKVVAQLEGVKGLTTQQKALIKSLKEMDQRVNLDEDDFMKMHMVINGKLLPILKRRATAEEGVITEDNVLAKETKDLYLAVRKFRDATNELSRQLKLKKDLSSIFQKHTTKMFDLATKTLVNDLSQTASELTKIEFETAQAQQRLTLQATHDRQNLQTKQAGEMLKTLKSTLLKQVEGVQELSPNIGGFTFKTFEAQITKKFGPAIFNAIKGADWKLADQAIAQALQDTTLGGATGSHAAQENQKIKSGLQSMRDAINNLNSSFQNEKIVLNEKIRAEREYIKATREAALAQLKLAQQIGFAGGLGGAAGSPIASRQAVEQRALDMRRATYFGSNQQVGPNRDKFMTGFIENIKVLKTLTAPGGYNPANQFVEPLAAEIGENIKYFLQSMGMDPKAFDVGAIAATQAKNLIKPDVNLSTINNQTWSKMSFTGNDLNVYVTNPEEFPSWFQQGSAIRSAASQQTSRGGSSSAILGVVGAGGGAGFVPTVGAGQSGRLISGGQTMMGSRHQQSEITIGAGGYHLSTDLGGSIALESLPQQQQKFEELQKRKKRLQQQLQQKKNPQNKPLSAPQMDTLRKDIAKKEKLIQGTLTSRVDPQNNPVALAMSLSKGRMAGGIVRGPSAGQVAPGWGGEAYFTPGGKPYTTAGRLPSRYWGAVNLPIGQSFQQGGRKFYQPGTLGGPGHTRAEYFGIPTGEGGREIDVAKWDSKAFAKTLSGITGGVGLHNYLARAFGDDITHPAMLGGGLWAPGTGEVALKMIRESRAQLEAAPDAKFAPRLAGETPAQAKAHRLGQIKEMEEVVLKVIEMDRKELAVMKDKLKIAEDNAKAEKDINKELDETRRKMSALLVEGDKAEAKRIGGGQGVIDEISNLVAKAGGLGINTTGYQAQLTEAFGNALKDNVFEEREFQDLKKIADLIKKALQPEIAKAEAGQAAGSAFRGRVLPGTGGAGPAGALGPLGLAASEANLQVKLNRDIEVSYDDLYNAGKQFLEANKDFPHSLKTSTDMVWSLDYALDLLREGGASSGDQMKFLSEQLRLAQNTIDMEKWRRGVADLDSVKNSIVQTAEAIIATAKGTGGKIDIKEQVRQLLELANARDKESASISKAQTEIGFVVEITDALSAIRQNFTELGKDFSKGDIDAKIKSISEELQSMANGGDFSAERMAKLRLQLEELGLTGDKAKRLLGLLSADTFKNKFAELMEKGINLGAKKAESTLGEYIKIIGDVGIGKEQIKKRAGEVRKALATGISGAISSVSSGAIEENIKNSTRYYAITGDLTKAQNMAMASDKLRTSLFADLAAGNKELADVEFLLAQHGKDAAHSLELLNREMGMLGSYDPRQIKQSEMDRRRDKIIQKGGEGGFHSLREGMAYLSDYASYNIPLLPETKTQGAGVVSREKRWGEVAGSAMGALHGEMATVGLGAESANQELFIQRAMSMRLNDENEKRIKEELRKLDEQRSEILYEVANGTMSAMQAEIQLKKARAPIHYKLLNEQLADGTISLEEYTSGMQELSQTMLEGTLKSGDFGKALKMGLKPLFSIEANAGEKRFMNLIVDSAATFKQGVKDSFAAAIKGAESFREAMSNVMEKITDKMLDTSIGYLVDVLFNALGRAFYPGATGGYVIGGKQGINNYHTGGLVTGGSGHRDDVPATLQKGEFVLNRKATESLGIPYLRLLNEKKVGKYQTGGMVDSANYNLQNTFDWNDPKKPTGGSFNTDSRLSALGFNDTSNPQNAYKFHKESTLNQYLKDKESYDEQKAQAMANYRKQRKGILQGALWNLALGAVAHGVSSAVASAMEGAGGKVAGVDAKGRAMKLKKGEKPMALGARTGITQGTDGPMSIRLEPGEIAPIDFKMTQLGTAGLKGAEARFYAGLMATQGAGTAAKPSVAQNWLRSGRPELLMHRQMNPPTWAQRMWGVGGGDPAAAGMNLGVQRRGGARVGPEGPVGGPGQPGPQVRVWDSWGPTVSPTGGGRAVSSITSTHHMKAMRDQNFESMHNRMDHRINVARGGLIKGTDSVPAMLTAGEWVVPKKVVDHVGVDYLRNLNKRQEVSYFAQGGYVGAPGAGAPASMGDGGTTSTVNNDFTINVNVTNEGGVSTETGEGTTGERDQNTQGGLEQSERNKELGNRIKQVVTEEIVYQKRPGGLLYNEKRTG